MAGSPVLLGAAALSVGTLTLAGYLRTSSKEECGSQKDIGLTSEVAALLVFILGYIAYDHALVASIIGLVTIILLYSRQFLHDFALNVLRPGEISAAITLAAFAFIVIPMLPNRMVDPWGVINPRDLGAIVATLAAIEFGGYAVERMAGPRLGSLATGFFGGLVSSTAVFVSLSKQVQKHPETVRFGVGRALMANTASLTIMIGIIATASEKLAIIVGIPVAVTAITSATLAFFVTRNSSPLVQASDGSEEYKNPLDMKGALKLGLIIFAILAITAIVQKQVGDEAVGVVSFISGLFELHGISFANASLFRSGGMTLQTTVMGLFVAVTAAHISKIGLILASRTKPFILAGLGLLAASYVAGALVALAMSSVPL